MPPRAPCVGQRVPALAHALPSSAQRQPCVGVGVLGGEHPRLGRREMLGSRLAWWWGLWGWGMRSRHFQPRLFSGHGLTWVFSFTSSRQTPVQDSVSHFQSKDSYSHRHNRFSPLTVLNHHYLRVSTVLPGVEAKRQSCLPVIRAEPAQTEPFCLQREVSQLSQVAFVHFSLQITNNSQEQIKKV